MEEYHDALKMANNKIRELKEEIKELEYELSCAMKDIQNLLEQINDK